MMREFFFFIFLLFPIIGNTQKVVLVNSEALAYLREAARTLTIDDVKNILTHSTLSDCMEQLIDEAIEHDNKRRVAESAMWVVSLAEESYSCEFWDRDRRVPQGFTWNGHIPKNAIFVIHTHPIKSGGPVPSKADYDFHEKVGTIGLILSYHRKVISINYPGEFRAPFVINRREFFRYFIN